MRGIKPLHDNTSAHKSKLVLEYLSKKSIQTLPKYPPYYLDLAPFFVVVVVVVSFCFVCFCFVFVFLPVYVKASPDVKSTPVQPSDPPFPSVWTTSKKRTKNKHSNIHGYKD